MLDEFKELLLGHLSGSATAEDVYRLVSSFDYSEHGDLTDDQRNDLGLLELLSLEVVEATRDEAELLLAAGEWLKRTGSMPGWALSNPPIGRSSARTVPNQWFVELPATAAPAVTFPIDWIDEVRPVLPIGGETEVIR